MTAQEVVAELRRLGHEPEASGDWLKFTPPPPLNLLMAIMALPKGALEAEYKRAK